MGKRKGRRSEISETLNRRQGEDGRLPEDEGEKGGGFFACYLLTSLSPRHKGQTYIGFTVNPKRRIRQHNGEIGSGAWRTKRRRPWEMVLCIYGFPTNVAALQFEWAWQHPIESLAVRKAAVEFKSLSGIANKIKLAYTMLTLPAWQNLNLTVNFFSTKYTKHYAGCPSLPKHMRVQVRSMDELPCYTEGNQDIFENDAWDDEEECDGTGCGAYATVEEEALEAVTPDHDSADNRNNNIKEAAQPRDESPIQREEDHRLSFCFSDSPERVLHSFDTDSFSAVVDAQDSYMSPVIHKDPVEFDWLATNNVSTISAEQDRPPSNVSSFPPEVEVIDVFTPSPEYRISLRRKKRSLSTVCPQIIDLTKSPIYV